MEKIAVLNNLIAEGYSFDDSVSLIKEASELPSMSKNKILGLAAAGAGLTGLGIGGAIGGQVGTWRGIKKGIGQSNDRFEKKATANPLLAGISPRRMAAAKLAGAGAGALGLYGGYKGSAAVNEAISTPIWRGGANVVNEHILRKKLKNQGA